MAQISFDRVYKLFGDVVAVDDLSLDIQDGEFLVLVGPSGCGKTTSLRMLAGFERATYGTVSIGGVVQNTVAPQNRDLAMVFQSYALYPHMTVYKNLAFGMKVRREPRAEVRPRVEEVARLLDIETLLDRRPSELSGGQRQRVALGRALLRSPRAFLMDEPLSNLDAALRVQMRVELKHLHDRLGVTTVYVTHDQVEAMTMGDRIAIMNSGRLQQADTPEAIYVRPANLFVAGFIGSPKMNLVRGRVSSQDGRVAAEFLGQTVVLAGALADAVAKVEHGEIVVGLRAEDLRLVDDAPTSYSTRLTGVVDVWEPLGSETYVVLKVADSTLTARFPPRTAVASTDVVEVALTPAHLHVFDARTEQNVLADSPIEATGTVVMPAGARPV
ncbi:MAG: multiple sugar transport system ATP-binding protein [Gaiellaceae bacterium]|nr:multiple sugar transport system ATP-binding protein [Gaiellaceae bacterium]